MALSTLTFVEGEKKTLKIQVKENGSPKDITGMSFKFAVKENLTDTSYKISPVSGTIDDAANGKVSFTFTVPEGTFLGVYEIAMYDASINKTVITTPGGIEFRVKESLID